ncbi:hypothetical protein CYLTODRAFT_424787 [Cylindrobasidium torrendii FP15055 ss-10]|uniref:Uncharacterized protein n=1 Tax=Cylindrobasidium torrendii FP15055 ss-10 TaxID=1314674 RepID=A0A0D7B2W2_9AGAR|nr:hypothetical protein CYLTODRAFT_424787 [Cylindrobasidium torrendii FP15055 ss-10]
MEQMEQMDATQRSVYKDILLKSTALSGITVARSTSAPKSPLNDVVQAFATLLTVTTPSDPTAANVVAATGIVRADSVSTIVTGRNKVNAAKLDITTIAERARDRNGLRQLATTVKSGNPELDVHMQDVAAFVEYVRLACKEGYDRFIVAASYFQDCIHHRAFEKIYAHMKFGYKFWEGGDPLKLLDGRTAGKIEPTEFSMHGPPKLVLEIFKRRALTPNNKGRYTVTTANGAEWLGVLRDLRGLINELIEDGTDTVEIVKGQGKRDFLKAAKSWELTRILNSMDCILECKSLVTALQNAYRWCDSFLVRPNSLPAAGSGDDRNEEDHVYFEDDGSDAFQRRNIVQGGIVHVFRYYRLFTAWTRATQVVIGQIYKMPNHRLEFHLVSAGALDFEPVYPKLTSDDVLAFMRSFPDVRERSPFKEITDTGDGFERIRGLVHCEAQLMGLMDLKSRGGNHLKAETLEMLPDVHSQIPIGVGKKCCYLCHILASQLEQTGRLKFLLPGTHGTVYPWLPPPPPYLDFEIVQRVGQLLDSAFQFHLSALRSANQVSSQNSLPASVVRVPLFDTEDAMALRGQEDAANK